MLKDHLARQMCTTMTIAGSASCWVSKGPISEFELNLLRQRSVQAILQKAQRGVLRYCLPIGLCWTGSGKIELDPIVENKRQLAWYSQSSS
jgi:hypothetical protein